MTSGERKKWLDSLAVGDLVAVIVGSTPNMLASVTGRTKRAIIVERAKFSPRTGEALERGGQVFEARVRIEPVTNDVRRRLEYARTWREVTSQISGASLEVLQLCELALRWRNAPDVIVAATERIHEVTKERREAGR